MPSKLYLVYQPKAWAYVANHIKKGQPGAYSSCLRRVRGKVQPIWVLCNHIPHVKQGNIVVNLHFVYQLKAWEPCVADHMLTIAYLRKKYLNMSPARDRGWIDGENTAELIDKLI
jgi:hypothetical protein